MLEPYILYALVILMSGMMIMPIAYDLTDMYKHNQTAKRLHREHDTRVHCPECSNYKPQNLMYSLDICLDCHDIQVNELWEERWGDKTIDIAEDING